MSANLRDECVQDDKKHLRWEASNVWYHDLETVRCYSMFGCSHGKRFRYEEYKELPSMKMSAWRSYSTVNIIISVSVEARTEGPKINSGNNEQSILLYMTHCCFEEKKENTHRNKLYRVYL